MPAVIPPVVPPQQIQARKSSGFFSLASAVFLLIIFAWIFYRFDIYDWQHPFVKAFNFIILFVMVGLIAMPKQGEAVSPVVSRIEILIMVLAAAYAVKIYSPSLWPFLHQPPAVDIGTMTQQAAKLLFGNFTNPYRGQWEIVPGQDPSYAGFKYGPFMIVAYGLSAFYPDSGFKVLNIVYLVLTAWLLAKLVRDEGNTRLANWASTCFVITALIVPARMWSELFMQGVNDVFPALLILSSLFLIRKKSWMLAGLAAGLSFSSKIVPAAFFLILFIRKEWRWSFFAGVFCGIIPILLACLWDAQSFINNCFLFHAVKTYDSTSLYSVVPERFHFIFPLVQFVVLLSVVVINFKKPINDKPLVTHFVLLMIVCEMMYKEMHCNHLVFLVPFLALALARYRYAPGEFAVRGFQLGGDRHE